MFQEKPRIVAELKKILPTYYELFVENEELPCITYIESNNYFQYVGDTIGYSYVTYTVKLWVNNVADINTYFSQIDDTMRVLGYTRKSYRELTYNNNVQCIATYTGLAKEIFN